MSCGPNAGACIPVTNQMDPGTCVSIDTCDATGTCKLRNGEPCTAGPDSCASGVCSDGLCCNEACGDSTTDCIACSIAAGSLFDGVCDALNLGVACNDGNLCASNETCDEGVCAGTPVSCPPPGECQIAGACDSSTGLCSSPTAPDGTACDGGVCTAGACSPEDGGIATDAGIDASAADGGAADAGFDASAIEGGVADAGRDGAVDAATDASQGASDASVTDATVDAQPPSDSGPTATVDAAGDHDDYVQYGGCACTQRGQSRGSSGASPVAVGVGLLVLGARRRRKGRGGEPLDHTPGASQS